MQKVIFNLIDQILNILIHKTGLTKNNKVPIEERFEEREFQKKE